MLNVYQLSFKIMVFFVGTKTRRTWSISSLEFGSDYDIGDGTEIQMVFRFANNDLVKVDGTVNTTTETVYIPNS